MSSMTWSMNYVFSGGILLCVLVLAHYLLVQRPLDHVTRVLRGNRPNDCIQLFGNNTLDRHRNGSECSDYNQALILIQHTHNHTHHHRHNGTEHWDCNRTWPSIALFMPVHAYSSNKHKRYYEVELMFLRTFLFFWPYDISNTSIILAYDAELVNSQFIRELKTTVETLPVKIPGGIEMIGIPEFPYYKEGYDRQQYEMFWADNFTTSEYIGFVDTDTAFITYVDREDLFENGKPVVNGRGGYHPPGDGVDTWSIGTLAALGILEPFKCMSYFPVIIKTVHLKMLRDFIANRHAMSFDEAFRDRINVDSYSQFGIMCTYLWTFFRDEYTWYVHSESPNWDGVTPPPAKGQDGNLTQFTDQMKLPKPRIATHVGWRQNRWVHNHLNQISGWDHAKEMNQFMLEGYCHSPPFPKTERQCAHIDPTKYHYEMHNFDLISYEKLNSNESLNEQARIRHKRLKHCTHKWSKDELKTILA